MLNLIRDDLKSFKPYSSERDESNQSRLWLNANESPWDNLISLDAIKLNRYPEHQPKSLLARLSEYYRVDEEKILLTRGSDEGIDLLLRLFCMAYKDAIMICPPTFGMYEIAAQLQGVNAIKVPLNADFDIEVESILSSCQENVKIIFLCSPNNPTGNVIKKSDIFKICKTRMGKSLVVVDEAYIEFAEKESSISDIDQFQNFIVLRTLSKAYGLAAARLGLLIANPEIINWLRKILAPYPISQLSIQAAMQLFRPESISKIQDNIKIIIDERRRLSDRLKQLPIVETLWPSYANFMLVKFKVPVIKKLLDKGIVFRDMSEKMSMSNMIRITIGTPEQNDEVLKTLSLLKKNSV